MPVIFKPFKVTPQCFIFLVVIFFLAACDSYEVVQIKVKVPPEVQVPEEMVYIPTGEFIRGMKKSLELGGERP